MFSQLQESLDTLTESQILQEADNDLLNVVELISESLGLTGHDMPLGIDAPKDVNMKDGDFDKDAEAYQFHNRDNIKGVSDETLQNDYHPDKNIGIHASQAVNESSLLDQLLGERSVGEVSGTGDINTGTDNPYSGAPDFDGDLDLAGSNQWDEDDDSLDGLDADEIDDTYVMEEKTSASDTKVEPTEETNVDTESEDLSESSLLDQLLGEALNLKVDPFNGYMENDPESMLDANSVRAIADTSPGAGVDDTSLGLDDDEDL